MQEISVNLQKISGSLSLQNLLQIIILFWPRQDSVNSNNELDHGPVQEKSSGKRSTKVKHFRLTKRFSLPNLFARKLSFVLITICHAMFETVRDLVILLKSGDPEGLLSCDHTGLTLVVSFQDKGGLLYDPS